MGITEWMEFVLRDSQDLRAVVSILFQTCFTPSPAGSAGAAGRKAPLTRPMINSQNDVNPLGQFLLLLIQLLIA